MRCLASRKQVLEVGERPRLSEDLGDDIVLDSHLKAFGEVLALAESSNQLDLAAKCVLHSGRNRSRDWRMTQK